MAAIPVQFMQAKCYTPTRVWNGTDYSKDMLGIAIHWMDADLASCDTTFISGNRLSSSHFGVENSTIHQYVKTEDTAWSVGDWVGNLRTISVEMSASPSTEASNETYVTSAHLCLEIFAKIGMTPSRDRLFPHNHFCPTECPGTVNLDRLWNIISGIISSSTVGVDQPIVPQGTIQTTLADFVPSQTVPSVVPMPIQVHFMVEVTVPVANVRLSPSLSSPIEVQYSQGASWDCVEKMQGDMVEVNGQQSDIWYKSSRHGWYISACVCKIL